MNSARSPSRSAASDAAIPSYEGGKFPLSTYLAERVREMLADPKAWPALPPQVRDWLSVQRWKSIIPSPRQMLVETFPRAQQVTTWSAIPSKDGSRIRRSACC